MIAFEIENFVRIGIPIEICLIIQEYKRMNNKEEFGNRKLILECTLDLVLHEIIVGPTNMYMFYTEDWTLAINDDMIYYVYTGQLLDESKTLSYKEIS